MVDFIGSAQPDDAQATGLWHTLLTMSPTGIALLRPLYAEGTTTITDFAWVRLNPAAQQLLGQPECPAESLLTLFSAAQPAGAFEVCRQAFETGQQLRGQTNYQAGGLDGYLVLVAQRYENVLVVNFTDTNDQHHPAAEQALRPSQARAQKARAEAEARQREFERLLTQAPAAICVLGGPELVFEFVNPAYAQLLPGRMLLGQPVLAALPELAGTEAYERLRRVYRTGQEHREQELYLPLVRPADGMLEARYFNFVHQARSAAEGFDGVLAFAFEVTEQVLARQQVQLLNEELRASNHEYLQANAALSQTQQQLHLRNQQLAARVQEQTYQAKKQSTRLARLLQEAPAAICMLDGPDLVFELVNPGYQQLFPNRALLGLPVLAALPEIKGGPVEAMLRGVYETGRTFEGQEVQMHFARPGDGQLEERYFNFIYQARYDEHGRIDGLVVFAFEVTEQVQTRQQIQALNSELTNTNEELYGANTQLLRTNADLDTFVYAASHDLKAPIANIEGLLNALRDYLPTDAPEPMVPRLLGMMEGAISRFQETVGHLTNIAHLQPAPEPRTEELDLAQVLEDVRLDVLPLLESTHAELRVAVADCPRLRFSAKNMRSILFNLLSNALKYHAPGRAPRVQVRAHCTPEQLVLAVQDNGLGLSASQQAQLFGMFRRLHTHVEGSGVGLYLIKRMIENAGGTIAVQSEPQVGSTFTVTLPRT